MLRFPKVPAPAVSIVVVTYGAWSWAERALRAVIEHTPPRYEVIVVDNGSTDGTAERLTTELDGARVVLNEDNRGFGAAANQGAGLAVGALVVFLNSDVLVHDGWLAALREAIESDPAIAVAAPRYLNLDGSLQEAGALVARDGTTAQYGAGDRPQRLEYRFRRVIDYAGAACLMVRRDAFEAAGGFDRAYEPAYYEDADLCFRLAARGWRTVYEPRSVVTHAMYGSGSHEAAVALTDRNRTVFAERWAAELAHRPPSVDPDRPRCVLEARDAPSLDRHLVIGSARLAEMLIGLWPSARVTLLARGGIAAAELERLLALGIEVAEIDGDVSGWCKRRRYHYDTVVARDAGDLAGLDALLTETQPHASRLLNPPLDRGDLIDSMCEAGVAPPTSGGVER